MRKMNHFKLLAVICAMALFASCNFEEINTNQFEMSDGEGAMAVSYTHLTLPTNSRV